MRKINFIGFSIALVGFCQVLSGCGTDPADGGSSGGVIAVGGAGTGSIGFGSPQRLIPGRSATTQYRTDIWTVSLTTGAPVTLLLCRTGTVSFDPYLSIHGPGGSTDNVQTDDDSAGMLGSRIVFTPTTTGRHTIYTSTFSSFTSSDSAAGSYRLTVTAGAMMTATCPN